VVTCQRESHKTGHRTTDAVPKSEVYNTQCSTIQVRYCQQPAGEGWEILQVDAALPGKHTRKLYDQLTRKEASVLIQLRTGMARLNACLFFIKATPSENWAPDMEPVPATIRFAIATGRLDSDKLRPPQPLGDRTSLALSHCASVELCPHASATLCRESRRELAQAMLIGCLLASVLSRISAALLELRQRSRLFIPPSQ